MFVLGQRRIADMGTRPHWYGMGISVLAEYRGCGYGTALVKHMMQIRAKEEILPFYAHTFTHENVEFYQKLGLKLVGEFQIMWGRGERPGPVGWAMICE